MSLDQYLSCLLIDLGENPDRPRPGRTWLRNLYRVHQRLCMAFPSARRTSDDPEFLQPFRAADFGKDEPNQVHVARGPDAGFLYRVDPLAHARAAILVQSAIMPNWDYAFHNARHLLAAAPDVHPFEARVVVGERFRFRLLANPTRRLSRRSLGPDDKPIEKGEGKRAPVPCSKLEEWLLRKAEQSGFAVSSLSNVQAGYAYVKPGRNTGRNGEGHRLRSVRYDGVLTVRDADRFVTALAAGIGPAKAFGFGLLSIAPA